MGDICYSINIMKDKEMTATPEWWEEGHVHTGKGKDPKDSHTELMKKFTEENKADPVPDNAWEVFFELR